MLNGQFRLRLAWKKMFTLRFSFQLQFNTLIVLLGLQVIPIMLILQEASSYNLMKVPGLFW